MKNYSSKGETIAFTNSTGSAIASGSPVVVGNQIGVAHGDIADTESGVLAMEGVFNLPKASAAVIAAGESVIFDVSAGEFDDNLATPAEGDISGACTAWESAGNGVTSLLVKINTGIGAVEPAAGP